MAVTSFEVGEAGAPEEALEPPSTLGLSWGAAGGSEVVDTRLGLELLAPWCDEEAAMWPAAPVAVNIPATTPTAIEDRPLPDPEAIIWVATCPMGLAVTWATPWPKLEERLETSCAPWALCAVPTSPPPRIPRRDVCQPARRSLDHPASSRAGKRANAAMD